MTLDRRKLMVKEYTWFGLIKIRHERIDSHDLHNMDMLFKKQKKICIFAVIANILLLDTFLFVILFKAQLPFLVFPWIIACLIEVSN